ncbi:hypothetical protein C5S35_01160 [Candidatus Methanophagaceae archaeon]|nr:hypothetical protein C5S35_01160 [Methanophagales archaeon]
MFNSDGSRQGKEFQVNSNENMDQLAPRTCELSNGDFMICWDDLDNNDDKSYFKYFLSTPLLHSLYSFSLQFPLYDETLYSTTVDFEWKKASQVHLNFQWELEYTLYLDHSEEFNNPQKYSGICDTTYSLKNLTPGQSYFWKVLAKNIEGDSLWSSESFGFYVSPAANIKDDQILKPETYILYPNFPNPFNPTTMISYQLPIISDVELSIYDILGHHVTTLVNNRQNAGYYQVEWDASGFASGVYFLKLEAANFKATQKMLLTK